MKQRRVGIGLVVLLIAERPHRDQPAGNKPCELALNRAGSDSGQADQLGCVVTAAGLAEEEPEHALLRTGEKSIREARASAPGSNFRSDDWLHTQNGHHYTQTEHTRTRYVGSMTYSSSNSAQRGFADQALAVFLG